ncbi:MAG: extracellular solute-binding protein [Ignisphaera sp.]
MLACPSLPEPSTPITLKFWKWQAITLTDEKIKEVINLWEQEHPNVKIEFTVFPELSNLEFVMKVEQSTGAGQGPDIIMVDEPYMAVLAYDGYLAEMPPYLQAIINQLVLQPFDRMLYLWGPDGKIRMYGFPSLRAVGPKVLAVNEYHLEEAGIPKDWCPKTWDELIDVAKKLTKYDEKGNLVRSGLFVRVGGNVGGISDKWFTLLFATGGYVLTCKNGSWVTDVNSALAKELTQKLYLDVIYKYKIYDPGFPGDVTGFANEQDSIIVPREPAEIVNALLSINPGRFKDPQTGRIIGVHFCPIPVANETISPRTLFDGHLVSVNAKSPPEKQQWAFQFLCWLATHKEVREKLYNEIYMFPPWKDLANEPPFDQPVFQQLIEIAKSGYSRVLHPNIGTILTEAGQILARIYLKETSLDDGLNELASRILDIANEAKNACK